jgi:hypothetical protein
MKVSWQVTGVPSDAGLAAHPFRVEQDKTESGRGLYVDPEAFGQAGEKRVGSSRQPR